MTIYRQEQILAMELDRSHIGRLVQIITDSWSMTGTLERVTQHDNRGWDIDYSNGRTLVPSSAEIWTVLRIGPWTGRLIGNQPVTVETVAGTLEAPERASLGQDAERAARQVADTLAHLMDPPKRRPKTLEGWASGAETIAGDVVEDKPDNDPTDPHAEPPC